MAAQIPAKLKGPGIDIQRFATRAAQLEKFRPVVTYWCEYWILQQLLSKQLHTADDECQTYAVQLMDKLEQTKSENPTNDAIIDDLAAKAYIENFATETFNRADEQQRTNKVTRQTAETFQASAVFLDLLAIWGQLEPEMAAKSKYAKFHALRIAKAIKAGEDPNASNPVVVEEPAPPAEDGLDQELRDMGNEQNAASSSYQPPTVESAPDSMHPSQPSSTIHGEGRPTPTSTSSETIQRAPQQQEHDVSPIEPTESADRQGSIGGGYFPSVPTANGDTDMTDSGQPSAAVDPLPPSLPTPSQHTTNQQPFSPANFYSTSTSAPDPDIMDLPTTPDRPNRPPPERMPTQPPAVQPPTPQQTFFSAPRKVPAALQSPPAPKGGYITDDEAVLAAQKHAKWAISALNFEDVNTAVKELRLALQSLGAS